MLLIVGFVGVSYRLPEVMARPGWGMVEGDHDVTESEMLKWFEACRHFGKVHRHSGESVE